MLTRWDRFLSFLLGPQWAVKRAQWRTAQRHYEAASHSRRTKGWNRKTGDANSVIRRALVELRTHARDLAENNGWAKHGRRVLANNIVGTGIVPKAIGTDITKVMALWKAWADKTQCDAAQRLTFSAMQSLVIKTLVTDGEVLVRRRVRPLESGLAIPLQLDILEADFLDETQDQALPGGGKVVQGVEYDASGRRVAYWLFDQHPGDAHAAGILSRRVPAADVLHIYDLERAGQSRGVSWLAAAIVPLKDFDEYEDATLMRQKIAACFAAFVENDDTSQPIGEEDPTNDEIETLQPGMVHYLQPGRKISFGSPPSVTDNTFSTQTLRKIARAVGVTYEDLTGDYSQVNYSSARMSRLVHFGQIRDMQWHMLIPLFCDEVWRWAMEAARTAGLISAVPDVGWTAPGMPLIEPDKEARAAQLMVRNGQLTFSEMIREQGGDPEAHLAEYAADMAKLKSLGIKLDTNVADVSQAGLTQERVGGGGPPPDAARSEADSAAELLLVEIAKRRLGP